MATKKPQLARVGAFSFGGSLTEKGNKDVLKV
jgi:hypothetical protein